MLAHSAYQLAHDYFVQFLGRLANDISTFDKHPFPQEAEHKAHITSQITLTCSSLFRTK